LVREIILEASTISWNREELYAIAPQSIKPILDDVIEEVVESIRYSNRGLLQCRLCMKGPYTPKGLYLHLRRKHLLEINHLTMEAIYRKAGSVEKLI
jgi:hypothetical protein